MATKNILEHLDELQCARVVDVVIDAISVFLAGKYAFVPQDAQVLRYVALSGADLFDDVLNADFVGAQGAQYLQSQRMRHGLQTLGSPHDFGLICDDLCIGCCHGSLSLMQSGLTVCGYEPPLALANTTNQQKNVKILATLRKDIVTGCSIRERVFEIQ
jgi:hypothetical protein